MSISVVTDGKKHCIKIQGRFDFSLQSDFRQAYESAPSNSHFIVDFLEVDYMDSSALGMLLILRDHAGGDNGNIELMHCGSEVKSILEISNFQKLFTIS